jgi:LmbE family N-acetylglucosaminyl deacetylase
MTHPDDELAIAAWIRKLAANGNDVFLSWTHHTPVRMREARHAANLLGVPQERLFFHHAPDQAAIDHLGSLQLSFQGMVNEVKPTRIVCGAFEQGHIDHDVTNYIVHHVFEGPTLEFPLYHTYLTRCPVLNVFAESTGQEVCHLTPEESAFKVMLAKQYPSQTIWRNVFWYEVWQTVRFRPRLLAKLERMRFQTHKDFLVPNLPVPLAKKVLRCKTWKRWEQAIRRYEANGLWK